METLGYRGQLTHVRSAPVGHRFVYPAFMLCIKLAELDTLERELAGFGYNRARLCSIWDRDYLFAGSTSIADKLVRCAVAAGERPESWRAASRIWLLTMPRMLMMGFNPLSLFVRTDEEGRIAGVVAEVHNTYGEVHAYVLPGASGMIDRGAPAVRFRFPKAFYVSPFNGLEGEYRLSIPEPFAGARMSIRLDLYVKERRVLRAVLGLRSEPLTGGALARLVAKQPFEAALTLPRIAWQALALHWRRRLPFRMKPRALSPLTIRRTRK
jgi:DUF1365 family protein